jgi:ribosomal protein S18 acetylase RimI-like enzyme
VGREYQIRPATLDDMAAVAKLFQEYADALDVDLSYQGFAKELALLPGTYAAPRGTILLACSAAGDPIGCVAVRPLPEAGVCEMKRLHIRRLARGAGVGRALAQAAIGAATAAGYETMRLDTLPTMKAAQALYHSLGFETTSAYYETPIAGTVFMCKKLSS